MSKKEKKERKHRGLGVWREFKAFISRGNVLDMAVGVVIGGAFSAIVTSVVNILLSLATWAVPGGLNGLITVLPAVNSAQEGMVLAEGGPKMQWFLAENFDAYARYIGEQAGATGDTALMYGANVLHSKYTLYGTKYAYNLSATINWGAVINAIISFLIVAVVLFIVVKTVNTIRTKAAEAKAKLEAELKKKEAEEKGEVVEEVPAEPLPPEPTTNELLAEILAELRKEKPAKKKAE